MNYATIELDRQNGAMYMQLCDALEAAIGAGELPPGERLPSERDLADQLGVSRTTVINAYGELQSRGLVRGHVGRGTFVQASPDRSGAPFAWRGKVSMGALRTVDPTLRWLAQTASEPGVISFAAAVSALDRFPMESFKEATDAVLGAGSLSALGLCPTEGHPTLRDAIARRFPARPEQILVVSGAQQALDLIARCLLDPGDTVLVERPGYVGAIQTFRAAGAHLVGWDIERGDLQELEDLIVRYRPKFLYTNPTFQNPTGQTMPLRARRELLDLAERYHLPVVEDEPYRDLAFEGPPPETLFHLDQNGIVIHIHTYSKSLAAGLRLGWLAAAEEIVDQLALFKQRCDVSSASLEQLVIARILKSAQYDAHMAALRVEHRRRYEAMTEALAEHLPPNLLSYAPVNGGLYLWAALPWTYDTHALLHRAEQAGVLFVHGEAFYPDAAGKNQLRLCFTAVPPDTIREGVRRLAGLFA